MLQKICRSILVLCCTLLCFAALSATVSAAESETTVMAENISGRSLGDINVQVILEKMGGGGHITFAGAQLTGVTAEEAKEKLLGIIEEYSLKD